MERCEMCDGFEVPAETRQLPSGIIVVLCNGCLTLTNRKMLELEEYVQWSGLTTYADIVKEKSATSDCACDEEKCVSVERMCCQASSRLHDTLKKMILDLSVLEKS